MDEIVQNSVHSVKKRVSPNEPNGAEFGEGGTHEFRKDAKSFRLS
jgi:hypothetical protein